MQDFSSKGFSLVSCTDQMAITQSEDDPQSSRKDTTQTVRYLSSHSRTVTDDAKRPAVSGTAIMEDRTMPKLVKRAKNPHLGVDAPYLDLWKLAALEPHLVSSSSQ